MTSSTNKLFIIIKTTLCVFTSMAFMYWRIYCVITIINYNSYGNDITVLVVSTVL
jgi:hypothetical protein